MTDKQPEEMQVPLYELLEDIPEDFRIGFKDNDNWSAGVTWHPIGVTCHKAAAELRRLHEVNAELVEALKMLTAECLDGFEPHEVFVNQGLAAIAKATGEQQ
jgi:hypothetical protein